MPKQFPLCLTISDAGTGTYRFTRRCSEHTHTKQGTRVMKPETAGSYPGPNRSFSAEAKGGAQELKRTVGDALDRGKSGLADSAQAAGEGLASDVAQLRDGMAALQETVSKFVSEAGSEAMKTAQNVGSAVGDAAGQMASAAKEQAKTVTSEIENMARSNPLGTLAATLAIGVVIGMISRGGRG
jgi:ElaB/YqjD/DUF883 family membrane-anchored ribosome-binding protein